MPGDTGIEKSSSLREVLLSICSETYSIHEHELTASIQSEEEIHSAPSATLR